MPKRKPEAQTIEYKSSWHDDYFEWISGCANAKGGNPLYRSDQLLQKNVAHCIMK